MLNINKLKETKPTLKNQKEIINCLKILLINSIRKIKTKNLGIAFSAGVDSSLIALLCSKLNKQFTLYTIGLKNSKDLEQAKILAKLMKWNLKTKTLTLKTIEKTTKLLTKIIPNPNPINVSIGIVLYEILKLAKQDNKKLILTGLGSEEIFAGYERHNKPTYSEIHKACLQGLKTLYKRDLQRDLSISNYLKIKIKCPFLDKNLINYSMQIHPKLKIHNSIKKYILRKTALSLGLPKQFAFRKKIAAQYGSKTDLAIKKLAKKNNFKYKKDYISFLTKL